jgi:hypothetical protein
MRNPAKFLLKTGAVLVVSASCISDSAVAPQAPTIGGNAALRALVIAQTTDFDISTGGGEFNLFNAFTLNVPAGAVCDPNAADTQAGYASAAWDSACTPASGSVTVHATAKWANGTLYVDFQPALRFVPTASVTLASDAFASTIQYNESNGSKDGFAIQYSPAIGAQGVPDAVGDPSVRTLVQGNTGRLVRRIKHFSGYQIAGTGEPCDPNAGNPLCVYVDEDEAFKH